MIIFIVVVLAVVAGLVALGYSLARGSEHPARTAALAAALVVATIVADLVFAFMSVYYVKPLGWIAATLASAGVAIGLAALLGRDVGWRFPRILAVPGVIVLSMMLFVAVAMSGIAGPPPLPFDTRIDQMAGALGFTAMVPAGEPMQVYSLPGEIVGDPPALAIPYEGFEVAEWASDGPKTDAQLEEYVRPAGVWPEPPSEAQVESVTVLGRPALFVSYLDRQGKSPVPAALLIFQPEGVVARIASLPYEKERDGEWVLVDALGRDELMGLAATFEPLDP